MTEVPGQLGSLSAADYDQFKQFLEKTCGIVLGDNKQYLVSSRLNKLMQENQIDGLGQLVREVQMFSNRKLKDAVVDAMTTNETLWFRDAYPFDVFRDKLLPELQHERNGPLKVWSAACSSGQEPYSLSMLVEEYNTGRFGGTKADVEIVATDLSASMLSCCEEAIYDSLSLGRGLSSERLGRHFNELTANSWQVKHEIRKRVRFRPLNLKDSFVSLGKFDVVFCRNVLIYFSSELKTDILRRIHGTLKPGGYLVLGASEGLSGAGDLFEMRQCRPGIIYRVIN